MYVVCTTYSETANYSTLLLLQCMFSLQVNSALLYSIVFTVCVEQTAKHLTVA